MTSLILHLHGPMQSWGGDSRFNTRSTERLPTLSALVGLLAAAHGRERGTDVSDLSSLSLTIRVDRPGRTMRDYHTVGGGYPKGQRIKVASGGERPEAAATLVSERYYLADAAFTVALGGDPTVVAAAADALERPRWAPTLGRRSCPPAHPFIIGVVDDDPVAFLRDALPVVRDARGLGGRDVTFVTDDPEGQVLGVRDQPTMHLNAWGTYSERRIRRWSEELEEGRFVTDSMALMEGVVA